MYGLFVRFGHAQFSHHCPQRLSECTAPNHVEQKVARVVQAVKAILKQIKQFSQKVHSFLQSLR